MEDMVIKKKVLHITVHLGGGAGKAISGICIGSKNIFDSSVVLLQQPKNTAYVEVLHKEYIPVYVEPNRNLVTDLIKNADVIVLNWWSHPLTVKFLQEFPNTFCRIIIWNHINGCTYPFLPANFLKIFPEILFTSKYSLNNSNWTDEDRDYIINRANIVYGMGNFIPEKIIPKSDYSHGEHFVIGYAGTLNYAKINEKFIDYYKSVIEYIPNVKFLMLGEPSEDLLADVANSGLEQYFEFPGYVSNVGEYYNKMDVLAYLLEEDNYATTENSLLEAMAHGLPIVVLDNPVEQSIIKDNISGYLVQNIDEFKKRILDLYNVDNAMCIGTSARKYVINEYKFSDILKIYEKAIFRCCNKNKVIYNFITIIGRDPYDAFLYFAGKNATIFKKYFTSDITKLKKSLPSIFFQANKSSIFQYEECFPDDKIINDIATFFRSVSNIV